MLHISIRQHTPAYVSIRQQHAPVCVIRVLHIIHGNSDLAADTEFTCFPSTKVQILAQSELAAASHMLDD